MTDHVVWNPTRVGSEPPAGNGEIFLGCNEEHKTDRIKYTFHDVNTEFSLRQH